MDIIEFKKMLCVGDKVVNPEDYRNIVAVINREEQDMPFVYNMIRSEDGKYIFRHGDGHGINGYWPTPEALIEASIQTMNGNITFMLLPKTDQ